MLVNLNPQYATLFQQHKSDLEKLVGIKEIHCVTEIPADSPKVVTLWGTFAIVLEEKKQLDIEALKQDIATLESYIKTAEQKLANPRFIEHAPAPVVEGVKKQLQENQQKLEALKKYL